MPSGGVVAGGVATIDQTSATQLSITQGSARAVIDWSSFNVAPGERVAIHQPSASAILLNRIHDSQPSQIFGQLTANGQVILANPNGMVFGPTSQVDVGGLVATTSRFADTLGFMQSGQLQGTPGEAGARILSEGQITAHEGGLVALVAPEVAHQGMIVAQQGRIQLAAGEVKTYDFYGDGLVSIAAPATDTARLDVGGTLEARGGRVALSAAQAREVVNSVVNLSGVVEASGLVAQDGSLVLAGDITVSGDQIALQSGSTLRADGPAGGGTVHVGGGWQGAGSLPWAKTVTMQDGATVSVSGTQAGATGGDAVLWSSDRTAVAGRLLATGDSGGLGGRVETSGLKELDIFATADVRAGQWLLDPADLVISSAASSNILSSGTNPLLLDQDIDITASVVNVSAITNALNLGTNVLVQTDTTGAGTGNITVSNAITTTGSGSLELAAFGSIFVNSGITLQGGDLTLRANRTGAADGSTGTGMIQVNSAIATNGGNITLGGGTGTITAGSGYAVGLVTGSGTLNDGIRIANAVNAGGGNIVMNGRGGLNSGIDNNHGIIITGAAAQVSTNGNGTISLNGFAGGTGSSTGNSGVVVFTQGSVSTQNGLLTITGVNSTTATGTGTTNNDGVMISATASVQSTGGDIIISGTGGAGAGVNRGVSVTDASFISSQGGSINITGTGGASTRNSNNGVLVSGLSSRITNIGSGTITLNGTGGGTGASNSNDGVRIDATGSVSTLHGLLSVNGVGGNASGTGTGGNDGVEVNSSGSIQIATGGIGDITVNGSAAAIAGTTNRGVYMTGSSFISGQGGAITVSGTGGASTSHNHSGIQISGISTRITNIDNGTISLIGTGGGIVNSNSNTGVQIDTSATVSTVNGLLSLTGTGGGAGNGISNHGILISGFSNAVQALGNGGISLTGLAGNAMGTGADNYGVLLNSTGGVEAVGTGTISVNGTGSTSSGGRGFGIFVNNGSIRGNGGPIQVNGTGGSNSGAQNFGVRVASAAGMITNIGTGSVIINAIGGNSSGSSVGLYMDTTGSISVVDGLIDINARGGLASATGSNSGVEVRSGSQIRALGNGSIFIQGTGGLGPGDNNYGVWVNNSTSQILSNGSGTITLIGTGGGSGISANNDGIRVENSLVVGLHGLLSITGVGGNASGTGTGSNDGVFVNNGNLQIAAGGSGGITVSGTGAGNTGINRGVFVGAGSSIAAQGGAISVVGTGGASEGNGNRGVVISGLSSRITNIGSGNITLNGTGNGVGTSSNNDGVRLDNTGMISFENGHLLITGVGGSTSFANDGIQLESNASIQVTGSGTVTLVGSGAPSATSSENRGVVFGSGGFLSAQGGAVNITGTGGTSTGTDNHGIHILSSSSYISNTGNGTITLIGTGGGTGASANNAGVRLDTLGYVETLDGLLSVTGVGGVGSGGNNTGVWVTDTGSQLRTTGLGNLTVHGTARTAGSRALELSADGSLSAGPGRLISLTALGGDALLGALDTSANLTVTAPSILISSAWGATTRLGTVELTSGSAMTLPAITAHSLLARTTSGSITLGGALDTAATSGTAITLVSAGDFINSGSHTFTVGTGARWLVYSSSPTTNTPGGLSADFFYYGCTYGGSCTAFPATGNGWLYRVTPVLVVTPLALPALSMGSAVPSLVNYRYQLSGYFVGDEALDRITGSVNGTTNYRIGGTSGQYFIRYLTGSLSSELGYAFIYGDNPAGIIVSVPSLSQPSTVQRELGLLERIWVAQTQSNDSSNGTIAAGSEGKTASVNQEVHAEESITVPPLSKQQLYSINPTLRAWLEGNYDL
jgi:filamentous hemagglutinin family protein